MKPVVATTVVLWSTTAMTASTALARVSAAMSVKLLAANEDRARGGEVELVQAGWVRHHVTGMQVRHAGGREQSHGALPGLDVLGGVRPAAPPADDHQQRKTIQTL